MNAVTESAGTTLLKALLNEIRQLPKPWEQTPEREQMVVIDRLREATQHAVRKLVVAVTSSEYPHITAMVESVTFKEGVKAVLKLTKEDGTHELADRTGSQVVVTMVDPARYIEGIERVRAAADQTDMFHEEQSASDDPRAEMTVDTLLQQLAKLGVNVAADVAAEWTEQERVVAWDWALTFEEHGDDCKIARPHWLPIPEPVVGNDANGSPTSEEASGDATAPVESEAA